MLLTQFPLLLFALLLITRGGATLRCYTCSAQIEPYDSNSECENFSRIYDEPHKISHCDYMDAVCAKHIVSYRGGTKWVHRGCHSNDICNNLQMIHSGTTDQLIECTVCHDRDLCNSSNVLISKMNLFHMALLKIFLITIFH